MLYIHHQMRRSAAEKTLSLETNGEPGFQDIFDEDSFYAFAACFTLLTCLAAFVASKYIKIKAKD